ncbi:hypothetical protein [Microbacterium phyllosphaerae]|uniref:hypothetical protein n=1 Tax=Microbacterium phyllosphaerae TaxID=124798 RepID=UPI000EA1E32B|nr:hypothetical protein [Microbacterium phyllosphaerae]
MGAKDILKNAWSAVEESGVPEALQETAFRIAVEIELGGDTPNRDQSRAPALTHKPKPEGVSQSDESLSRNPDADNGAAGFDEEATWVKFADEAEIDRELLEQLFYFNGRTVHLNVKAHKLSESKPAQMRAVAFALTVAYNYALDIVPVETAAVRSECERLKCLDTKNFGTYMGSVDGLTASGPPAKRVLKVKSEARKLFEAWVTKMAGEAATA